MMAGLAEHPEGMTMYALRRAARLWRPELGDFDAFVGRSLALAYDAWFLATRPGAAGMVRLRTDEHALLLGATYSWGSPEALLARVPAGPAESFASDHPVGSRVRTEVDAALEGAA